MPDRPEVTAVEIARLAGVGRAAVSNWRRRHADFPRPVGGTDSSPTFRLDQVEGWLRAQGKLAELPLLERVWQLLETVRDPAGHPAAPLVGAGAFLLLHHRELTSWAVLAAEDDTRVATALPRTLARFTTRLLGPEATELLALPRLLGSTETELARRLSELALAHGAPAAYEQLLTRYAEANTRQLSPTPPEAAALLAALAEGAGSVLDPACGLADVLLAVAPATPRYAQELDPVLAALALLRLALHTPLDAAEPLALTVRPGDSLRADAHPGLTAGAVLCQPPYNERDWGHDELQYDPRWPAGQLPPRGESELAWVLHCLARTRPGGTAALLLPPTVASRRAGRRVRAELLRTGALRAVVALPAGAAPPYGVPLHLWVLRRPEPGDDFRQVLLLDAGSGAEGGRERINWPELHETVTGDWRAFDAAARSGAPLPADRPGRSRAVPAIDLLDDETDLSPARHLPPPARTAGLGHLRARLTELLDGLGDPATALPDLPDLPETDHPEPVPTVTVGELIRSGALELHSAGAGAPTGGSGGIRVLDGQELAAGTHPTAFLAPGADRPAVLARPGDVLVHALGGATARTVRAGGPYDGIALGRQLHLLRPDPEAVDPDYLAGQLRSTAVTRRAASHASTTTRLDLRRAELPRLPLQAQRDLGAGFARIAAFDETLQQAAALGALLAQELTDAVARSGGRTA
ncbi:N-6 DNA methylase [Kitasatospora sp. NPDC002227]|uniref:N-6 DNA methylase n=1 Tax=Kitasatospora sp. NPDC002227 TaxID=3154773 RepID=UPI00331A7263